MMPQFARPESFSPQSRNFTLGMFFFVAGLVKKIILADTFSEYASPTFNAADSGLLLSTPVAWIGTLTYTLQLYFDFSGYSDMAIGLSKMFGIDIPLNFNSPYRSTNIVEFWRRWHMTLSKFLRDYLYIPLGGNRGGVFRRHLNLMITMLLGGLWHGANWTFVVWGGLHGAYLVIAHTCQTMMDRAGHPGAKASPSRHFLGWLLTLLCVMVAWVFFRATSFSGAWHILGSMFDPAGIIALTSNWPTFERAYFGLAVPPNDWSTCFGFLGAGCGIAFLAPNTQTLARSHWMQHCMSGRTGAAVLGFLLAVGLLLLAINASHGASEFIYFNF
jgi:D-alanyl-lipoteichoic acid acyltransferase DltB (MBOAT superfamily)